MKDSCMRSRPLSILSVAGMEVVMVVVTGRRSCPARNGQRVTPLKATSR